MITLIIEALYALVFAHSLVTYVRRRDPVQRDLTLVFAPLTSLLLLEVVRRGLGRAELPLALEYVGLTLLLAQPYLTLRLVRTLRPVPRWAMRVALGVFVATVLPFYVLGEREIPLVTLAVVAGFFGVQGFAAALLGDESRRRTGAPRARLALAAAATAVLGLCLLVAAAGSGGDGPAGRIMKVVSEVLALLSGASYVVAFMPPRWLRRVWAGGAAYRVHHQLASAPVDDRPVDTWRRYTMTVRDVSGAAVALVLLPTATGPTCVAASGEAGDGVDEHAVTTTAADLAQLLDRPQPVPVVDGSGSPLLDHARQLGARVLVAVPVQLPAAGHGALVLLSRRHPLFVEDDARLLGELGAQAAILAERGTAAEAIRAANAQLERRVEQRTTELRLAQSALEDVNHQLGAQNVVLARSNERLQRFAYVASHDLQEPLRKIISFSGLLTERMPDGVDDDIAMYVDRIVGSASRMKRLIEDLLMFSRVGAQVDLGPVDCAAVLRSVLDALALALEQADATVTHDEPLPVVVAHPTLLEMLFQNLIGNAIKYRSEEPPRIHIAAEDLGAQSRVTVTDNGIGIDMAYSERIFQVFQRLHARDKYEGTGIGLAVCQRVVEACGGRIGVDSVPGAGSTFWFTLPAAPQPQPIRENTDVLAHNGR
jgi:signal transduction histidine kinase